MHFVLHNHFMKRLMFKSIVFSAVEANAFSIGVLIFTIATGDWIGNAHFPQKIYVECTKSNSGFALKSDRLDEHQCGKNNECVF